MIHALCAAVMASLLLASVCRATRPGGLLAGTVGAAWQWWLVEGRPGWLPGKLSGDCTMCTCFWLPGIPVAVAVAALTPFQFEAVPINLWAFAVPFLVGVVSEISIHA